MIFGVTFLSTFIATIERRFQDSFPVNSCLFTDILFCTITQRQLPLIHVVCQVSCRIVSIMFFDVLKFNAFGNFPQRCQQISVAITQREKDLTVKNLSMFIFPIREDCLRILRPTSLLSTNTLNTKESQHQEYHRQYVNESN